jgi:hypothetical protein
MKNLIFGSLLTLTVLFEANAQVKVINRTNGSVEILPNGVRASTSTSPVDSTNIALGTNALVSNTLSHRNIAIGIDALRLFNLPNDNLNTSMIAIGHGALRNFSATTGTTLGIAIGKNALGNVTQETRNNIVIGHFASENNRGDGKIVIGHRALSSGSTDTDGGVFVGNEAASSAPSGGGNTVVGERAMRFGGSANNTLVGTDAGAGTSTSSKIGTGNVMLGNRAGRLETGSNKLYIENSDSTNTLIGGDFALNRVGINRSMANLAATSRTLQVEGSALVTGTLQLPTGAGVGKILQSDADGNASWQTPAGLWSQSGNFIQNTNPNGFWSPYSAALPVNADNTSYPPVSPATGNGTRMAWIPSRSAFQGGTFNMADGSVRFISENIGLFSFCYGLNAEARSWGGIAMGVNAVADGTSNTIAFGENTSVRGGRNMAMGFDNTIKDGVSNTVMFAENSVASEGQYNFGLGRGLTVDGYGTTYLGIYSAGIAASNNSWVTTDPLLVIGNGTSEAARSNAVVIRKNGQMGIGTLPNDRLHVAGDIRIGTGTTGCVKDADGTVIAGTCASDQRFKQNITPFAPLLARFVQLRPVHYDWRTADFPDKHFGAGRSYGLIAQEVAQVFPELVTTDADGYKAVNYSKLPLMSMQAIKELKAENDELRAMLLELKDEVTTLKMTVQQGK